MGVLNVTPDSFSDGGLFYNLEAATKQIEALISDGVDIIDVGAESSRPGADTVSEEEEWRRLEPILKKIRLLDKNILVSVDTRKPEIMKKALLYNINYINNIEGLADKETLQCLAKEKNLGYIGMHMHKSPKDMQRTPLKGEKAVEEVRHFFIKAQKDLTEAGFEKENIWLDPGIGFGKNDSGNFKLMGETQKFSEDYNLVVGISRKSWIGRNLGIENPIDRDAPSKTMELGLAMAGAKMIRTHDVKSLVKLRTLWLKDD